MEHELRHGESPEVIIPTNQDIDEMRDLEPGEQLVACLGAFTRLNIAVAKTDTFLRVEAGLPLLDPQDEAWQYDAQYADYHGKRQRVHQLYREKLSKYALYGIHLGYPLFGSQLDVEALPSESRQTVIETYQGQRRNPDLINTNRSLGPRDAVTGLFSGLSFNRMPNREWPAFSYESTLPSSLCLREERHGRFKPPLWHHVQVVDPATGEPLVRAQFLHNLDYQN